MFATIQGYASLPSRVVELEGHDWLKFLVNGNFMKWYNVGSSKDVKIKEL